MLIKRNKEENICAEQFQWNSVILFLYLKESLK
ncbi:unnamed protein product [Larinioides sclopetarius]|uniref:Uncharacterized protein n=1 Tax=Larinioides sclopetarius TaxID=280406 RepID=A0AAV2ABK4_9ARAC